MAPETDELTEKAFYLDEFRGRTVLVAAHLADGAPALGDVAAVVRDLAANDTRVVLVLGGAAAGDTAVGRALAGAAPPPLALAVPADDLAAPDPAVLLHVWRVLRSAPVFVGWCGACGADRLPRFAAGLAAALRVHKLVITDPLGGVQASGGAPLSFMDEAMTEELLRQGEAESAGLAARRPVLDAIRQALHGGVGSVNLCRLDGLGRELFTYEGSGTLFTREDYCTVERLGIDDFRQVEQLLERGQREGYLKRRTDDEIATLLLAGWGATIGAHHLAGVCALETRRYAPAPVGEIVGLYTITRFKGEGVGVRLVRCMKAHGQALGLAYLFACTTLERVGQFFERQGFRRVGADDVPVEKWADYDGARRAAVAVYRFDLAPETSGG